MSDYIVRFNLKQRIEHFVTMVVFALLCLTGLPQKFYQTGWAHTLVDVFGGVDSTRWIHRICGIVLAVSTIVHFTNAILLMLAKRTYFSMVPTKKDFEDVIQQLKYYLGMTEQHPQYDRFTYKEKFEYWGARDRQRHHGAHRLHPLLPGAGGVPHPRRAHPGREGRPLERGLDGLLRHHDLAHLQRAPEPGRVPLRRVHLHW